MAKVTFEVLSKSANASIYLRFTVGKGKQFRCKTGHVIDHKNWSPESKFPKKNIAELKNLRTDLSKLGTQIEVDFNNSVSKGVNIDRNWLLQRIDDFHGLSKHQEKDKLVNHFKTYIESLTYKKGVHGKDKISPRTAQKYQTIKNKITAFQNYKKTTYYVKDVDMGFRKEFINFLKDEEKLSNNTIGRYIKFLKTVCIDAKIYGIETSDQLTAIHGFTEEAEKIHFTFKEIDTINKKHFKREALNNAKDWLVLGCHIGQRVSDLLTLTRKNLSSIDGIEIIEVKQKKTGKQVFIPVNQIVKDILDKRNGNFPPPISAQKFNVHIKDVAKLAGILEPTQGAKIDKETKRKKSDVYPKWELVTSHICRRSFASNYYGEMPTSFIITITGHSTEKQFLEYVGKPPIDHAKEIAKFMNQIYRNNLKDNKDKSYITLAKAN